MNKIDKINWIDSSVQEPPKDREILVRGGEVVEYSFDGGAGMFTNSRFYFKSKYQEKDYNKGYFKWIGRTEQCMSEPRYWAEVTEESK